MALTVDTCHWASGVVRNQSEIFLIHFTSDMPYRRLHLSRPFCFFLIGLFYLYWGFLTFKVPCLGFSLIWTMDTFFILSTSSNIHNRVVCVCVCCVCCTCVCLCLYVCVCMLYVVHVRVLCCALLYVHVCVLCCMYVLLLPPIFQRRMPLLRLFKVTL